MTDKTLEQIKEYFRTFCAGFSNARPLDRVLKELAELYDLEISRNMFQNIYLQTLRRAGFFIGPSGKGMFLVRTPQDASRARSWFLARIASEQRSVDELSQIITQMESEQI